MRGRSLSVLLALGIAACHSAAVRPAIPTSGVAADVAYLASPALQGRAAGSPGGEGAAVLIAGRYESLGLSGVFPAECASSRCAATVFQFFQVHGMRAQNVAATVPGVDPVFRGRYVVVGAHYDHLGRQGGGRMRPGADDNASGTAAVLELGRRLVLRPAPTSVLLAHFDAEELGLVGSHVFVEHPPVPLDSVALMINLDMVGRLRGGQLLVEVTSPAAGFRATIDSVASAQGITLRFSGQLAGRSDHTSFAQHGVPAVALSTGYHADLHRATDTTDKIDFAGLSRIVDLVEALVRVAAARPVRG